MFLQNLPWITCYFSSPNISTPYSSLSSHVILCIFSKILTFVFDVIDSFFWDMTPCSLIVGTCVSEETAAFVFLVPDITSHKTSLNIHHHEGLEAEQKYSSSLFNFSARRGWVVNAKLELLYPWEQPGTCCIGGWVGPRAGLDGYGISHSHQELMPRLFWVAIVTMPCRPTIFTNTSTQNFIYMLLLQIYAICILTLKL